MVRQGFVLSRAFGEFAVIVLGVLVALGADAWNDRRLDRLDELEYLSRVHGDLTQDTLQYDFVLSWMDRKLEALDSVASWIRDTDATPDSAELAQRLAAAANFGWNVGPLGTTATFEDLRSTGRLGLISNPDLRTQLIRYRENAQAEDRRIQARKTGYPLTAYRLVRSSAEPEPGEFGASEAVEFQDAAVLLGELRASELRFHIPAERNRALFVRQSIRGLREQASSLIVQIADELSEER